MLGNLDDRFFKFYGRGFGAVDFDLEPQVDFDGEPKLPGSVCLEKVPI
jgi:hypothetical protein